MDTVITVILLSEIEALLFIVVLSSFQDAQAENAGQSVWAERRLKLHLNTPHPSCTSSISTYIAKDRQHTANLGKPLQVAGHILNAAFF